MKAKTKWAREFKSRVDQILGLSVLCVLGQISWLFVPLTERREQAPKRSYHERIETINWQTFAQVAFAFKVKPLKPT